METWTQNSLLLLLLLFDFRLCLRFFTMLQQVFTQDLARGKVMLICIFFSCFRRWAVPQKQFIFAFHISCAFSIRYRVHNFSISILSHSLTDFLYLLPLTIRRHVFLLSPIKSYNSLKYLKPYNCMIKKNLTLVLDNPTSKFDEYFVEPKVNFSKESTLSVCLHLVSLFTFICTHVFIKWIKMTDNQETTKISVPACSPRLISDKTTHYFVGWPSRNNSYNKQSQVRVPD